MDYKDYFATGQSAAITVAFLYIIYLFPTMFRDWTLSKKEVIALEAAKEKVLQDYLASERTADRLARHEAINKFQEIIADLYRSNRDTMLAYGKEIADLRVAIARMHDTINGSDKEKTK